MKQSDAVFCFDLGTGGARTALIDRHGSVAAIEAEPIATRHPYHGWSEQNPNDWWSIFCRVSERTMQHAVKNNIRVIGVAGCGHMHAPVLISNKGELVRDRVQLWNDKRSQPHVDDLNNRSDLELLSSIAGNPPASSWPGLKLRWMNQNDPEALVAASWVLMPKDFINFRLTGKVAQDQSEAGSSFLFSSSENNWSPKLAEILEVPAEILPTIQKSSDEIGVITPLAAQQTAIPANIPVFCGGGDYPLSVFGSGAINIGDISDITGTSSLLTRINDAPFLHSEIMNAATPLKLWQSFCVVDAAGDAIRWGRHKLENNEISFAELNETVANVPVGADGLLFLPYLTGERLGLGPTSRAAFVGLTASHGKPEMHRAILEGTALALRVAAEPMLANEKVTNPIIAAGGGARSEALLKVKASVFEVPFIAVNQVECGLLGSAALAMTGLGWFSDENDAIRSIQSFGRPIHPDEEMVDHFAKKIETFAKARNALGAVWKALAQT